ncbi:hypothetical protein WKW50_16460 [Ochrobactrum sp. GPK 3]
MTDATAFLIQGPVFEIDVPETKFPADESALEASGEFAFPAFSSSSEMDLPLAVLAAPTFPALAFSGKITEYEKDYPDGLAFAVDALEVLVDTTNIGFTYTNPPPFGFANITFASFASRAEVNFFGVNIGEFNLPAFGASGEVDVPLGAAGQFSFAAFRSNAALSNEPPSISGEMHLPAFSSAGFVEMPVGARAAVKFPPFQAKGSVDVIEDIAITGSPILPSFRAAGAGTVASTLDGSAKFPAFKVSGAAKLPSWIKANLSLPSFGASGQLASPYEVIGAFTFPQFTANGYSGFPLPVDGFFQFPRFGSAGRFTLSAKASGQLGIQPFTAKGYIAHPDDGSSGGGISIGSPDSIGASPSIRITSGGDFRIG